MIVWEGAGIFMAIVMMFGMFACFGFSFVAPGQKWTWYVSLPIFWFIVYYVGRYITRYASTWMNEDGTLMFPGKHHTLFFIPADLWWVIVVAVTSAVMFFG